jgi:hypothetical protein
VLHICIQCLYLPVADVTTRDIAGE